MRHLNLARFFTSISYNNFFENIAKNSDDIAKQSVIKISQNLICINTGSYDYRYKTICGKYLEKTFPIGVTVYRTHHK